MLAERTALTWRFGLRARVQYVSPST
ncbi:hypothetical protein A2U01_0109432, partial [Trifolium medium]|nr:hypothetical protein [Trifolium medium]